MRNDIAEDYCSFEVSRLLREKGFDAPCRGKIHCSHYHLVKENKIPPNVPTSINEMFAQIKGWNNLKEQDYINNLGELKGLNTSIPSHSLAIKWVRESYDKVITVYANASGYLFEIHDSARLGGTHRYDSGITGTNESGCWNRYEDATEAALLYFLSSL
jgi:hypothetical protein